MGGRKWECDTLFLLLCVFIVNIIVSSCQKVQSILQYQQVCIHLKYMLSKG